jgi:hypothetical protein
MPQMVSHHAAAEFARKSTADAPLADNDIGDECLVNQLQDPQEDG